MTNFIENNWSSFKRNYDLTVEREALRRNGHMRRNRIEKYWPKLKVFYLKTEFEPTAIEQGNWSIDWFESNETFDLSISIICSMFFLIRKVRLILRIFIHFPCVFESLSIGINENFLCKSTFPNDDSSLKSNSVQYLGYRWTTSEDMNLSWNWICTGWPNDLSSSFLMISYSPMKWTNASQMINDRIQFRVLINRHFSYFYHLQLHFCSSPISENESKNEEWLLLEWFHWLFGVPSLFVHLSIVISFPWFF